MCESGNLVREYIYIYLSRNAHTRRSLEAFFSSSICFHIRYKYRGGGEPNLYARRDISGIKRRVHSVAQKSSGQPRRVAGWNFMKAAVEFRSESLAAAVPGGWVAEPPDFRISTRELVLATKV